MCDCTQLSSRECALAVGEGSRDRGSARLPPDGALERPEVARPPGAAAHVLRHERVAEEVSLRPPVFHVGHGQDLHSQRIIVVSSVRQRHTGC